MFDEPSVGHILEWVGHRAVGWGLRNSTVERTTREIAAGVNGLLMKRLQHATGANLCGGRFMPGRAAVRRARGARRNGRAWS
jgi:hypothetical protein